MKKAERKFEMGGSSLMAGTRVLAYSEYKGQHRVVEYLPAGEDLMPNVHRFATIEEARVCWKRIQDRWLGNGWAIA